MPVVIFRRGSFAVHIGDHLRLGIICGPIWGSFVVGDHLRRCTVLYHSLPFVFNSVIISNILAVDIFTTSAFACASAQ